MTDHKHEWVKSDVPPPKGYTAAWLCEGCPLVLFTGEGGKAALAAPEPVPCLGTPPRTTDAPRQ